MSDAVTFFVPGRPYAKKRPRFGRGRTYSDPETVAAEHAVRWYFRRHGVLSIPCVEKPLEGPVRVEVTAVFAPPASWGGRKKVAAAGAPHVGRPDLDNVVKLVLDALNPLRDGSWGGAWRDDGQISEFVACKRYARADEQEGVTVTIEGLER